MHIKLKKAISFVTAMLMVLTMLPSNFAFAAENVASVTIGKETTEYTSFDAALEAAKGATTATIKFTQTATEATITLQADINISSSDIIVESGKKLSINLNGKTMTCNKITVNNGGTLNMSDSENNSGKFYGYIYSDGELNISGGTYQYNGPGANISNWGYTTIYTGNCTGVISGGIFNFSGVGGTCDYALYISINTKLKLTGGTFGRLCLASASAVNFTTLLEDGYRYHGIEYSGLNQKKFLENNITVEKCTDHAYKSDYKDGNNCIYCNKEKDKDKIASVAINGGDYTEYDDFGKALTAAKGAASATIKLLNNYTGQVQINSGNITFDLNGCTLESGSNVLAVTGASTEVTVTNTNTTKEGVISQTDASTDAQPVISNESTLTIDKNVEVKSACSDNNVIDNTNKGSLFINGADITGGSQSINQSGDNSKLQITGGTFEKVINITSGTATISGGTYKEGVTYANQSTNQSGKDYDFQIKDGTFEKDVNITSGNVTISGGTYKEGVNITSSAITISGGTYTEVVKITSDTAKLSGGTYNGGITLGGSLTLGGILADGYAYFNNDGNPIITNDSEKTIDYATKIGETKVEIKVPKTEIRLAFEYTDAPEISVVASNTLKKDMTYQWYRVGTGDGGKDEKLTNDETNPKYQLPTGLPKGEHNYYCVVTTTDELRTATSSDITVKVMDPIIEVTIGEKTTKYADLNMALDAAQNATEAKVKLIADIEGIYSDATQDKGNIILDLNGYNISDSASILTVKDNANVTVINSLSKVSKGIMMLVDGANAVVEVNGGTLSLGQNVTIKTTAPKNTSGLLITGGTVTINGAKFVDSFGDKNAIEITVGTLTINDGTFNAPLKITGGTVQLSGGTYNNITSNSTLDNYLTVTDGYGLSYSKPNGTVCS